MSYPLTDETATYVLIFWIVGADGSTSFKEQKTAQRVLDTLGYDTGKNLQTTHSSLGAMSTKHLEELIEGAISYINRNFTDDKKRFTYQLLETIAMSSGGINKHEQQNLDRIKSRFGI
ncbi:MAG: hypothetical protein WC967_06525 [Balneolaceae bacterium]